MSGDIARFESDPAASKPLISDVVSTFQGNPSISCVDNFSIFNLFFFLSLFFLNIINCTCEIYDKVSI